MYYDSDNDSSDISSDSSNDALYGYNYNPLCDYCGRASASKQRESDRYCKFCYKHLDQYLRDGELMLSGQCEECIDTQEYPNRWCQDCMVFTCANHIHTGKVKCVGCRINVCTKFIADGICMRCVKRKN